MNTEKTDPIYPSPRAVDELALTAPVPSDQEFKAAIVIQANANQALEGLGPDAHDRDLQRRFVEGSIGIGDLLKSAHLFASSHGKNRG